MARIIRHEGGRVIDIIPGAVAADWEGKPNVLIDPDESAVAVLPLSQWRVQAGALRAATAPELAADVAADSLTAKKLLRQRAADAFGSGDTVIERALALWTLDQVNVLRAAASPALAAITPVQMRNGILLKMSSGDAD